jgi:signal transduction histidine kinase
MFRETLVSPGNRFEWRFGKRVLLLISGFRPARSPSSKRICASSFRVPTTNAPYRRACGARGLVAVCYPMLEEFIAANREEIITRAKLRVSSRTAAKPSDTRLEHGVPILLTQIVEALATARTPRLVGAAATTEISDTAALHGHDLLKNGLTVGQVVNAYGDVCQVVTQLAGEATVAISPQEFHVFNNCLDEAVAGAVTAYGEQRERDLAYEGTERLGVLAHEMRNLLNTMTLAFAIIRDGKVGLGGSTGAMLARSMSALSALVDRSVAEVRLEADKPKLQPISMVEFMEEMQISGAVHAEGYGLQLTVHPVDRDLMIDGDWHLLASAVSNLLQNAFKFSRAHGRVSLSTRVTAERVMIDVSDACGGLPPGKAQDLFRPFVQGSADRSGLGLGLSIARSAARANAGDIHVRDIPGTGCVFTIDLPRRAGTPAALAV